MKCVNKATLLGHVTRDPELKATQTGQSVCTFGVATNRYWKDQRGQKQTAAEFHNVVAWGRVAEFCARNVRKGKPLFVEGYLKTHSWDGVKGDKMSRTEVVLDNIVLLNARPEAKTAEEDETEAIPEAAPAGDAA